MIEWYRANTDFYAIMDDIEQLFASIKEKLEGENFRFQILHFAILASILRRVRRRSPFRSGSRSAVACDRETQA